VSAGKPGVSAGEPGVQRLVSGAMLASAA